MDNFKIISQALSQNNADINNLDIRIGKINSSKEDSFIILNTDAFSGLTFGSETTISLGQDIVLSLFNVSSASVFYSQIRNYDNKTFVLKPTNNSFIVDSIEYTITTCTPCVGKIHDYGNIPVLCLTFLFDTVNSETALFRFFVFGTSSTEISANLMVENFDEIYSKFSTTGHTHTEFTTLQENIDNVDSKLFVGTQEEYDVAYAEGKVAVGALVIILDEESPETSMLGKAILGTLILGKK